MNDMSNTAEFGPYAQNLIFRGRRWSVLLHPSQYYLGRSYLWLNSGEGRQEDLFLDTSMEEYRSLRYLATEVAEALTRLFIPDSFNWAAFGNETEHLHVHCIPRYREPREFRGVTFRDELYGQNPAPYPKAFTIPDDVHREIRDALQREIRM